MALVKVAQKAGVAVFGDTVADVQSKIFDYDADIAPLFGGIAVVEISAVYLTYLAGGVGGTRQLVVDLLDSGSVVVLRTPIVQNVIISENRAFSLTQRGDDLSTVTIGSTVYSSEILPTGLFLCSGMKIRVGAVAGSDATDDMTVYLYLKAMYGI